MEEEIHLVSSTESPELSHLKWAVTHSSIVGLDCEWKPVIRSNQTTTTNTPPPVLLLQIACQLNSNNNNNNSNNSNSEVFLVDLSVVTLLGSIHDLLTHLFLSPHILKLGFRFKQDLLYLSSTFTSHGHQPPSQKVEPFIDIASLYNNHLLNRRTSRKNNNTKSLSFICHQLLGISLSKELQCSDWSVRPLTQDQINYAALDALSLIHIFNLFRNTILTQGAIPSIAQLDTTSPLNSNLGLNQILMESLYYNNSTRLIFSSTLCQAADLVKATIIRYPQSLLLHPAAHLEPSFTKASAWDTLPMDYTLLQIVRQYGDKLILTESDGKPRTSRKRGKRKSSTGFTCKEKRVDGVDEWVGPPPWDLSLGGDGCPKFLCDVMVEGLAKHLRCVGIDAAIPYSRKPETRELIDQAIKEKRVILTRDAKLLRHEYLLTNQIYRVKSLLKNDQLIEVIETFQLKISEDQLMSRCTKCNGRFIQKPLSIEEALEAAKGFQVIPNCLFDRNIEFWQCTDCNQLYWEGTQYHNAVQKFIDVCKITSTE